MIDDLEARSVLAAREAKVVDGGDVHQHVEPEIRVVPADAEGVGDGLAGQHRGVVAPLGVGMQDTGAEALAEPGEDRISVHTGASVSWVVIPVVTARRAGGVAGAQYRWVPVAIFSWSFISPSITLSGRGGQPGMYTSTGMMVSMPCTVA